jgi:hypothetical protein
VSAHRFTRPSATCLTILSECSPAAVSHRSRSGLLRNNPTCAVLYGTPTISAADFNSPVRAIARTSLSCHEPGFNRGRLPVDSACLPHRGFSVRVTLRPFRRSKSCIARRNFSTSERTRPPGCFTGLRPEVARCPATRRAALIRDRRKSLSGAGEVARMVFEETGGDVKFPCGFSQAFVPRLTTPTERPLRCRHARALLAGLLRAHLSGLAFCWDVKCHPRQSSQKYTRRLVGRLRRRSRLPVSR